MNMKKIWKRNEKKKEKNLGYKRQLKWGIIKINLGSICVLIRETGK